MALEACSSSEVLECSAQKTAEDVTRDRDRISELPADILLNILSFLETRDSVRTSILSKRWRNVWTSVPVLDINSRSLHWLENFVDGLVFRYDLHCLRELRLCCDSHFGWPHVRELIPVVATWLDDFRKLDISFRGDDHPILKYSPFMCKILVVLTLSHDIRLNLPSSVYLPKLKQLHLVSVTTLDVDSVQKLLAGCPALEQLHIKRHYWDDMKRKILCIMSPSLKRLTFDSGCLNKSFRLLRVVINAPNLEGLDIILDGTDRVEIASSMTSLVTVDLRVRNLSLLMTNKINALEILMKLSNTKYLHLSAPVVESLHLQSVDYLPMLKNLTHCKVNVFRCHWPILSVLLESSPNLISFACHKVSIGGCSEIDGQFHPHKCAVLYLEKIELHRFGLGGHEKEMVSYFLENAPALKTMSITIDEYQNPKAVLNFHGEVLRLPKASTSCEIYIRSVLDS